MNRRGFLGAITAAISAVQLPPLAKVAPVTTVTNAGGAFVFTGPMLFDYGRQMALALALPDGRRQAARTSVQWVRGRGSKAERAEMEFELKRILLDWAEQQYKAAA